MLRRVLTYHLAVLVLLTNIGVPVFTHICYSQGKSWTSVLLPARSCCTHKVTPAADLTGRKDQKCCAARIQSSPCCDNEISLVQMDCDLPTQLAGEVIMNGIGSALCISTTTSFSTELSNQCSFLPHAPPILSDGKSIILKLRTIRC